MLALTVKQPYAWAIMAGHKTIEWRDEKTRVTEFALHAGKGCNYELQGIMERLVPGWPKEDAMVRGAVLGVVTIMNIYDVADDYLPISDMDYKLGYHDAKYAWGLEIVERFENPIPARGMPGFWHWTHPDEAKTADEYLKSLRGRIFSDGQTFVD